VPRLSPTLVLALSCGPLDRRGSEAGCPSSEAAVALTNKSGAPNRVEDAHALADPLNNLLSCLRAELASPHGVLRNPDRTRGSGPSSRTRNTPPASRHLPRRTTGGTNALASGASPK
jgi:hypothetical protein